MGIIVDLIIVAVIAISTFLAYKKGLIAQAIKLCAVIVSILITLVLYKPVSNLVINTTNIDETIQSTILAKSSKVMQEDTENNERVNEILEQTINGTLTQNAKDLSIQIINISVIIILFIVSKLLLGFVTGIANKVSKLPILNQFNKAGGIIYGLLRGLVLVYICLLLISFAGQINKDNVLYKNINESNIGKLMYENNVLNVLL